MPRCVSRQRQGSRPRWTALAYIGQDGRKHRIWVFVMTLGWSRACYVELVRRADTAGGGLDDPGDDDEGVSAGADRGAGDIGVQVVRRGGGRRGAESAGELGQRTGLPEGDSPVRAGWGRLSKLDE